MVKHTVGIDFGTSTTLVAIREPASVPRVIPIGLTTSWMPSVIGVEDGKIVVGENAEKLPSKQILRSVKSYLTHGIREVNVDGVVVSVRDGVKAIVTEAIDRAERNFPRIFENAEVFVGCPALWTGDERRLLVDIFHECGIKVDIGEVIDEPIAAGSHWAHEQWRQGADRVQGRAVIFDAGGGTLDVAFLEVSGTDQPSITVLSAEGNAESGDALDKSIARELSRRIAPIPTEPLFERFLLEGSRELKEALSFDEHALAVIPAPYSTQLKFNRSELEDVFSDQLARAVGLTKSTLGGALLRAEQPESPTEIRNQVRNWDVLPAAVQHVAVVGGLSQIPIVQSSLAELFPNAAVSVVDNPQESVVRGLTYGDQLDELNLPRPPVDFIVALCDPEIPTNTSWPEGRKLVYGAFTPLYSVDQIMTGNFKLGFENLINLSNHDGTNFDVVLRCVLPTRGRETVKLQVRQIDGLKAATGIRLRHDGRTPIYFKLYTNGRLVFRTSHGEHTARVDKWPSLRGPNHNVQREIEMEQISPPAPSQLLDNDWRFQ